MGRKPRKMVAFPNPISAAEMGKSCNKAADLIRKTTSYTLEQPSRAQSPIHRSGILSTSSLEKLFSGLVEKNKSLEVPVNSCVWGVHLSKQLSFENCLYYVRLPIFALRRS